MELDDWEYLSDDGFTDELKGKENGKIIISTDSSNSIIDIDMNYFSDPVKKVKTTDPVRVSPEPSPTHDWEVKEVISASLPDKLVDLDTLSSQVSAKETTEDQFADMKLDSPKSTNGEFTPKIELGIPQLDDFEDQNLADPDEKESEDDKINGGLDIWKMGMTGIGAVFSFGVAFATVCVIALGSQHREKQQSHNLHFPLYSHHKRMKRVVHHAVKLSDVISTVRGAGISRAHVSMGGFYEGL